MKGTSSSWPALLALWTVSACAELGPRADDHTIARTRASGAIEGRRTLGMPIPIPGQGTCLIPYSLETRKRWFEDPDPYASGWYLGDDHLRAGPTRSGSVRWHNAILSDPSSGEQWMVLSQRGVIERWCFLGRQPRPDEPFVTEAIVFIATIEDSNRDGVLDDRDASVAIVTDGDGRNPRRVTPADAQVWSYAHDEERSRLYLLVVSDTNADGKYTAEDAPVPFGVDLAAREVAVPLVTDATCARTEAVLLGGPPSRSP
jgi:hypothetical protein